jgi:hypothetical protein
MFLSEPRRDSRHFEVLTTRHFAIVVSRSSFIGQYGGIKRLQLKLISKNASARENGAVSFASQYFFVSVFRARSKSSGGRMRAIAGNSAPVTWPRMVQGATPTLGLLRKRLVFPKSLIDAGDMGIPEWRLFYSFVIVSASARMQWCASEVQQRLVEQGVEESRAEWIGELYGHCRAAIYCAGRNQHRDEVWSLFLASAAITTRASLNWPNGAVATLSGIPLSSSPMTLPMTHKLSADSNVKPRLPLR